MELKGKNVLITGGAGAIGGQLAKELSKIANVIIIDNLSSGYEENIPDGIDFIEGDITNSHQLDWIFLNDKIDVIFHLAAFFANQNSVDHPKLDLMTNGMGTLNLLELSKKHGVEKFIYASSSCVNGTIPNTPYAITKKLGEAYTNLYYKNYGLSTVILRYFNSYGPGDRPGKYRSVIPNFIDNALKGKDLIITGTGEETRDFTYIDDTVRATILSASIDNCIGEAIDIGTGYEVRVLDVACHIKRLTKKLIDKPNIIDFKEKRSWDTVERRVADTSKMNQLLNYSAKTNIVEGLEKTIDWMKNE